MSAFHTFANAISFNAHIIDEWPNNKENLQHIASNEMISNILKHIIFNINIFLHLAKHNRTLKSK